MHYYGSYPGYPAASKASNGQPSKPSKPSKTTTNHSQQVTSRPTVYHPYPSSQKSSFGGCGCGSKLPKR